MRALSFVLAVSTLLSGCGTISSKNEGEQWGHPYSGVTETVDGLECALAFGSFMLFIPTIIYVVDIPLSALADTLVLPVDLMREETAPRRHATWTGHC